MCTSNYMSEGTESEANSGEKGKKKNQTSLIVWNLPPPEQSVKYGVIATRKCFKLRWSTAQNIQSTEVRQLFVISPYPVKTQISSIIPKFLQYPSKLLPVAPFYYFLPSDSLVSNHYIPSIRDMHEIKLACAPICIWINYLE